MSRRSRSKQRSVEIDPPYRDAVFMESLPARPVRILTEYIDPLERLRREKVGDTIVMFGSARRWWWLQVSRSAMVAWSAPVRSSPVICRPGRSRSVRQREPSRAGRRRQRADRCCTPS